MSKEVMQQALEALESRDHGKRTTAIRLLKKQLELPSSDSAALQNLKDTLWTAKEWSKLHNGDSNNITIALTAAHSYVVDSGVVPPISPVPASPPFESKRAAALALYSPPFKFFRGYIYDSTDKMVSDDNEVTSHIAQRVRGWGKIGYLPNAAELQDEVGCVIAEALTAYWASPQPDMILKLERQQGAEPATAQPYSNDYCRGFNESQKRFSEAIERMKADSMGLPDAEPTLNDCLRVGEIWPEYIAGMIECYLVSNPPVAVRESGIALIIKRRMKYLPPAQPVVVVPKAPV